MSPRDSADFREDGEMAFEAYPGIYREEAIMLLRDFYMQENHNGMLFVVKNSRADE